MMAAGQALTAGPYSVFSGFDQLFRGFDYWLGQATGTRAHGNLYAPEKVHFHGGAKILAWRDFRQRGATRLQPAHVS